MDFRHALNIVTAELTPQPWDYTTHDGTRLRVIPEGLRQDAGDGAVLIQICEAAHVQVIPDGPEFRVRSSDMPELLAALDARSECTIPDGWDEVLAVRPEAAGMRLAYTVGGRDTTGQAALVDRTVLVPEEQRMPLASALARALDVARSWEDAN
jgi:hypothetical protein